MFEELYDKRLDIFIGLGTGIVAGLLVLAVDRATKGREGHHASENSQPATWSLTQVTSLSVDIRQQQPAAPGAQTFGVFFVVVAVIAYIFNRDTVLAAALLGSTALVGVWLSVALFSFYTKHTGGLLWPVYLALMMAVIAAGALTVLPSAMAPAYAPPFFDQWQATIDAWGLISFLQWVGPKGATWLIGHVAGMFVYFLAIKDAAMSMIFYGLVGSGRLKEGGRSPRIVRATAAYGRRPYKRLAVIAALLVAAYYLVNGTAVIWLTEDWPAMVNTFFHRVMFGRQGS